MSVQRRPAPGLIKALQECGFDVTESSKKQCVSSAEEERQES